MSEYHKNKILRLCKIKLNCKKKNRYDKNLHTNEILKRILYHTQFVNQEKCKMKEQLTKTELIKTLWEELIPHQKYYLFHDGSEYHIKEV